MGDTRQDILDASLVLFAEQGYDKTSLREIAEQVGVTKAALYYHFPSKEQILVALFEPVAAMQDQLLEDLRNDVLLDPATWVPALERVLGAILENRRLWSPARAQRHTLMALNHEGDFAETHQELHRRTEAFFADDRMPLEARIRLACAFGVDLRGGRGGRLHHLRRELAPTSSRRWCSASSATSSPRSSARRPA